MAELFINAGADVDILDINGQNCLIYASMNDNIDIVKLILQNPIKINTADQSGQTAYSYAKSPGIIFEIFEYIRQMKGLTDFDKEKILNEMRQKKEQLVSCSPLLKQALENDRKRNSIFKLNLQSRRTSNATTITTLNDTSKPQSLQLFKKIKEQKFKRVYESIESVYRTERKKLKNPEEDEFLPERVRNKKHRIHLVIKDRSSKMSSKQEAIEKMFQEKEQKFFLLK